MVGFAAIIFRNAAFHRDPAIYARLVKLVLFSASLHQAVFVAVSSLPFAVGQVLATRALGLASSIVCLEASLLLQLAACTKV
eukprot:scaffold154273_cov37-Tisochrysis_lutea.AAC.3